MNNTITIGRSSSCDIVVPDDRVSRTHATLSVVDGKYVFRDVSSNGSTLNGEYINGRSVAVAPGAPIMLSDRVPLPWAQIYARLPLPGSGGAVYSAGGQTQVDKVRYEQPASPDDHAGVGWCILAFLIPIVGLILYGVWCKSTPNKAKTVGMWALAGFILNLIFIAAR